MTVRVAGITDETNLVQTVPIRSAQTPTIRSMLPGTMQPLTPPYLVGVCDNRIGTVQTYELVHPSGDMLPAFTAGAHTNVLLPSGLIRQYSLFNDAAETHRYCIAVQRENNGRGGIDRDA